MLPTAFSLPAFLFLSSVFILSSLLYSHFKQTKDDRKQPPGPPAWPVIGNLHMLGSLPHRSLQSMAQRYGPIMSLRLGHVPAIVISSPEAAEHVLKTHDVVFASRPKNQASEIVSYGSKGLVFSEYGPYFRFVRKLCTLQLLTSSKVEMFGPMRKEEVGQVVKSLEKAAAAREVVNLSEMVGQLVEDMTNRMILGRKRDDRFDMKKLVREELDLEGALNVADFIPWLRPFDLQGITRCLKKNKIKFDEMLETIIEEHEQSLHVHKSQEKDFVDILLSFMDIHDDQQNQVIDRASIKAILSDMIITSIDTSAAVTIWGLSKLLRHPRVMKNLQDELENVIGMNKMVEEIDLPKLKYLDMVLKETLRLYPIAPLLIPRESSEDVVIDGYHIKKKSHIIVNAWAIGRNTKIWSENAEEFYPKRFENCNIDIRGHDFQLIPFGSGRRGCPGMQLGITTVKIILAQLVHCFKWELPHGMSPSELDMTETFGITMPKANHLLAIPTYRLTI